MSVENCIDCDVMIDRLNSYNGRCGKCHAIYLEASSKGMSVTQLRDAKENRKQKESGKPEPKKRGRQIVLTTESTHNLPISDRLGIITAEVVVGMNIFKDVLTGVRNIVGGRTGNVQTALKDMRDQALGELREEAANLGADAVVGIDLDYNEIGATGSTMLMLVVSGTAVKLVAD